MKGERHNRLFELIRSGIAPRSLLVSVHLAAQCRCAAVNFNVGLHVIQWMSNGATDPSG
jgi:hypothetical protein